MEINELKNLWAPWRESYILKPKPKHCVFCEKANADSANDRENLVLERTKNAMVIMNTYPYNAGHLLIIPYAHVSQPEDLPREIYHEVCDLILDWKIHLKETVKAHGMNIGANVGGAAGAGIAEHLHYHIIPRWPGDTNFITTIADTRVVSQSLTDLYDKLKSTD